MLSVYSVISFVILIFQIIKYIQYLKPDPTKMLPIDKKTAFFTYKIYIYLFVINIVSWVNRFSVIIVGACFFRFNEKFESEFEVNNEKNMINSKGINQSRESFYDCEENKQMDEKERLENINFSIKTKNNIYSDDFREESCNFSSAFAENVKSTKSREKTNKKIKIEKMKL